MHDGAPGGNVVVNCLVSVSDSDNDDWGISYEWCYGEDDPVCFNTNSFSVNVSADDDNQANLEFSACDAYGDCGTASVTVAGVEPNTAPTVQAGEDMDDPSYQHIYMAHDSELGGSSTHHPFDYLSSADAEEDGLTYVFSYGGEIDAVFAADQMITI